MTLLALKFLNAAVAASATFEIPNNAMAIVDNLNNLLPATKGLALEASPSVEDFTCPFANSEVTTNDCVVLFQITLKILFMRFLIF